jgi:hypothetical protein
LSKVEGQEILDFIVKFALLAAEDVDWGCSNPLMLLGFYGLFLEKLYDF